MALPHRFMFRYNAVLFDMDGTLLDTVDDLTEALNQALLEHHFPTHDKSAVTGFLGNGAKQLIHRALPKTANDEAHQKVLHTFREGYGKNCDRLTRPYPGILSMLSALEEAGMKLAIISNKTDARVKHLTKSYFGSLIHTVIGSREGVPLKPAPDMLRLAMRELSVEPERTLYIGDSNPDYEAAQNAEVDVILARWGYGSPKALAQLEPLFFVNDPAELPMLILQEMEDEP